MGTVNNKRTGKAMKWSFLTQIIAKLVSPITNMVLARILAPEAFGAVASINLVITFAEIFTDAGFQQYLVQHEFESEESLDKSTNVAFWINMVISFVFIFAITMFRDTLATLVGSPELGWGIAVASINILLVTLSSTQTARYNRDMNFKVLFYARMCTIIIPVFVTIPLALIFHNYWALIIGTIVTNLTNAVVLTIFSKWKPKLFFDILVFKKMFSFSIWLLIDSVAIWLTNYIGTFIVGRSLDEYYLGLYKTSMTTVNSIAGIITMAVGPVMFSQLSRCQNDDIEMKKTFYSYQKLSAIALVPLGIGFYVFRDLVTWILLGTQWIEASDFVGLWGLISTLMIIFNNYCSSYYRSKGKPKIALLTQVIYLCVLVPTLAISVSYGFKALYISRSLVTIVQIIIAFLAMKIFFGFRISSTLFNILPMAFSAIIMGCAGWLLKGLIDSYWWHIVCVVICIIVYFAILFALFPNTRRECLDLVYRANKKKDIKEVNNADQ